MKIKKRNRNREDENWCDRHDGGTEARPHDLCLRTGAVLPYVHNKSSFSTGLGQESLLFVDHANTSV